MNKLGISSACYYPLVTEKSLLKIAQNGIKCAELFINSPSELSKVFIADIKDIKNYYNIDIASAHPFMSFAESYFLFSSYERRFYDAIELYKNFFDAMRTLGAKIFIIHGAKIPGRIPDEMYFERFAKLIEIGKTFEVWVCQENVACYRSQDINFLKQMKNFIGCDFGVVLDIKQAKRAGLSPYSFIDELHGSIKHIHISDYNRETDCIPPGEGEFDFPLFFKTMKNFNYGGAYIIELYNHSYENERQIYEAYEKINKMLIDY